MKKRGQMYSDLFKYFLIAFVVIMIIIFGLNSINKIQDSSCNTEEVIFEQKLKKAVEGMYGEIGSVVEKEFSVPCGVDTIYFADLEKDMEPFMRSLYEFPLVGEYIRSNVERNVFLVKNGKIYKSFYAGKIQLEKPYFVCSDTSSGKLGLFLGGQGFSTDVINTDCGKDCTFEVTTLDEDQAREILGDAMTKAAEGGVGGFPQGTVDDEVDRFIATNQTVRIARRCNCGRNPGKTVVEIVVKPEGSVKHYKLIESIPKELLPEGEDLTNYLESVTGEFDYYRVIGDPLIMWHFSEITDETVIGYTLNNIEMMEYCGEVLKSVGIGVTLESEGLPVDTPEELLDNYWTLNLPNEIVANPIGSLQDVTGTEKKIVDFLMGDIPLDTFSYEIRSVAVFDDTQPQTASVTCNDGTSSVVCEINIDNKIICNADSGCAGEAAKFYIKVSNDEEGVMDSFTVTAGNPVVTEDCGDADIEADCDPTDCRWIPECNANNQHIQGSVVPTDKDGVCVSSDTAITESYECVEGECNAQCDSTTILDCDGCFENGKLYDCDDNVAGSTCNLDSCTKICPRDENTGELLCMHTGLDDDADGYDNTCEYNCHENKYMYPSNPNTYCDCTVVDSVLVTHTEDCTAATPSDMDCDGCYTNLDSDCGGTEISCDGGLCELQCYDNLDNDCDGLIDCEQEPVDCEGKRCDPNVPLKKCLSGVCQLTIQSELPTVAGSTAFCQSDGPGGWVFTNCVASCSNEVCSSELGAEGWVYSNDFNSCTHGLKRCRCSYIGKFTECSENPECPDHTHIGTSDTTGLPLVYECCDVDGDIVKHKDCLDQKPLRCWDGEAEEKSSLCGCPEGQEPSGETCQSICDTLETSCMDNDDNDCDGPVDCADLDCDGQACDPSNGLNTCQNSICASPAPPPAQGVMFNIPPGNKYVEKNAYNADILNGYIADFVTADGLPVGAYDYLYLISADDITYMWTGMWVSNTVAGKYIKCKIIPGVDSSMSPPEIKPKIKCQPQNGLNVGNSAIFYIKATEWFDDTAVAKTNFVVEVS
ncbi:MAG: hypothetical protein ABIC04_08335 [Nanoarchaeota archaeon]